MRAMGIDPTSRSSNIKWQQRWMHFKRLTSKVGGQARKDKAFIVIAALLVLSIGFLTYTILDTNLIPLLWEKFGYGSFVIGFSFTYNMVWLFTRQHPNRLLPFYYMALTLFMIVIPFSAWIALFTNDANAGGVVGYNATVPLIELFGTVKFMNAYIVFLSLVMITGAYMIYPMIASLVYDIHKLFYQFNGLVSEEADFQIRTVKEPVSEPAVYEDSVELSGSYIVRLLDNFGLKDIESISTRHGPMLDEYVLRLPHGLEAEKVVNKQGTLSNNLGIQNIVIDTVVPGQRRCVSVQVPKLKEYRELVRYEELITNSAFTNTDAVIPMLIGKNITGRPVVIDLQKMKHILVAGETGAGKSKLVEVMLLSMLQSVSAEELELIIVDPKQLEMTSFANVPHLRGEIITDPEQAQQMLVELCDEMDERYTVIAERARSTGTSIRNISDYNASIRAELNLSSPTISTSGRNRRSNRRIDVDRISVHPGTIMRHLVVDVDECADLMMHPRTDKKIIEDAIARIAQKGRAAGIHLILATQRPTVDVITGLIKANMPCRIALRTASNVDSRTIMDVGGAEKLLGDGDAYILNTMFGSTPYRVHGAYIDDEEVVRQLNNL